jgi:predicted DNA-binding transcriptional regulator YafY
MENAVAQKTPPCWDIQDFRNETNKLRDGGSAKLAADRHGQDLSDAGRIDAFLLPAFETAFLDRMRLSFDYRDARGGKSRREVEPQAMLILPPLWYLVAWDPARGDIRHFRMDRISCPHVSTDTPFRRRHVPFADDVCPFRDMTG